MADKVERYAVQLPGADADAAVAGRHTTCPDCGAVTQVYDRVVGYLQPVSKWNAGKRQEEAERTARGRATPQDIAAVLAWGEATKNRRPLGRRFLLNYSSILTT